MRCFPPMKRKSRSLDKSYRPLRLRRHDVLAIWNALSTRMDRVVVSLGDFTLQEQSDLDKFPYRVTWDFRLFGYGPGGWVVLDLKRSWAHLQASDVTEDVQMAAYQEIDSILSQRPPLVVACGLGQIPTLRFGEYLGPTNRGRNPSLGLQGSACSLGAIHPSGTSSVGPGQAP
jgi:hypothetical protein